MPDHSTPCADCQKAMHSHDSLEYLYCGHQHVVLFRLADGRLDSIPVESTAEAIALVEEAGCQSYQQAAS